MKQKIQLPMIIGVFLIIAIFFIAAECDEASKTKPIDKITLTAEGVLTNTGASPAQGLTYKKDGGAKKDTVYWTVNKGNDTFITIDTTKIMVTSKTDLTFTVKNAVSVTTTPIAQISDNKEIQLKNQDGFIYLTATSKGNEKYSPGEAKLLILVGAVPVMRGDIVFDKLTYGQGTEPEWVKVTADKTRIIVDENATGAATKTFTVYAKVKDTFPPEAPLTEIVITLNPVSGIVTGVPKAAEKSIVLTIVNSKTPVALEGSMVAPYSTARVKFMDVVPTPGDK